MTSHHFDIIKTDEPVEAIFKITKHGKPYDLKVTLDGLHISIENRYVEWPIEDILDEPCIMWRDELGAATVQETKVIQRPDGRYGRMSARAGD